MNVFIFKFYIRNNNFVYDIMIFILELKKYEKCGECQNNYFLVYFYFNNIIDLYKNNFFIERFYLNMLKDW